MGGFGPVERTYHLCRRRKWIRVRERIDNSKVRGANSNRCFLATNCIFATVLATTFQNIENSEHFLSSQFVINLFP